jgi:hypothetical protein
VPRLTVVADHHADNDPSFTSFHTNPISAANFVGYVVGVLNVLLIRLRSLLLAASLSFEIGMVYELLYRQNSRADLISDPRRLKRIIFYFDLYLEIGFFTPNS